MSLNLHLQSLGVDVDAVLSNLPDDLTLSFEDGVLFLKDRHNPKLFAAVDFLSGRLAYRSQQHINREHLIKACLIKGKSHYTVLDATCGFGRDAYLLAMAGFDVTACELNPVVVALLSDGIQRLRDTGNDKKFTLRPGDATTQMKKQLHDIIYLDPMFPSRAKSAKVKKDMQLFHRLHTKEYMPSRELLEMALISCRHRVVVKRPSKAPLLNHHTPTFQVSGKSCRFDIYQCH